MFEELGDISLDVPLAHHILERLVDLCFEEGVITKQLRDACPARYVLGPGMAAGGACWALCRISPTPEPVRPLPRKGWPQDSSGQPGNGRPFCLLGGTTP